MMSRSSYRELLAASTQDATLAPGSPTPTALPPTPSPVGPQPPYPLPTTTAPDTVEPTATETATASPTATGAASPQPTATETTTLEPTASATPTLTPTLVISATPTLTETLPDGIVTPGEGGELHSADGRVHVIFPAGAVTQTVRVEHLPLQIEQADRPGLAIKFELNAHTTDRAARAVHHFQKPLELRVDFKGLIVLSALRYWQYPCLAYLDEQTGKWVALPTQREGDELVTHMDHLTTIGAATGDIVNSGWLLTFTDAQVSTFSGAFTYDYPIDIPEGRGGLTPDLSLSYNSRRIDGLLTWAQADWVGLGWTLDTMEIVRKVRPDWDTSSRCPAWWSEYFYYENEFTLLYKGVSYKLKPATSNPYGRYYTEDEQFLYIERRNGLAGNGADNQTSEYWIVRLRDGTEYRLGYLGESEQTVATYYYSWAGSPPSSAADYAGDTPNRVAFRWRVDQIQDTRGNRIEFSYHETAEWENCGGYRERSSYLTEIRYNPLGDGNWGTRITFLRAPRSSDGVGDNLTPTDCWSCRPFYQDDFLQKIRVENYVNGQYQVLREYCLTYNADPANTSHVRLLHSITEYGLGGMAGDGGHVYSLPATSFSYTPKNNKGTNGGNGTEYERSSFKYSRLSGIDNGYGGVISASYGGFEDEQQDWNQKAWNYYVSTQTLDGQVVSKTGHQYQLCPYPCTDVDHARGRELETVYQDTSGAPLKRVSTEWVVDDLGGLDQNHHYFVHPTWVREYTRVGTSLPGAPQKQTYYEYGTGAQGGAQYGNITRQVEYTGTTCYRQTYNKYYPNADPQVWIVDKPALTQVYASCDEAAGKALQTSTEFIYDDPNNSHETAPTRGDLVKKEEQSIAYGAYVTTQAIAYTTMHTAINGQPVEIYLPWRVTDGNGHTTQTDYDSLWLHPETVTDPLGHQTAYHYDPVLGQVDRVTDPNGAVTAYAYDAFGRLEAVAQPGDSLNAPTVRYDYRDGVTLAITTTTAYTDTAGIRRSLPTVRFHNGLGRLMREARVTTDRSQMDVTDTTYNAQGLPQEVYAPYRTAYVGTYATPAPGLPKTTYQYDALGRVITQTNPSGATVSTSYNGLQRTVIDENGHQKVYTSDALGRLTQVQEYTGAGPSYTLYATTTYAYNPLDLLTDVWDTANNHTQIHYDALGRKTSMSDPDMGTWSYQYDNAGNLVHQTDARGQGICFTYDALNRLTGKQYITGTTCPATPAPSVTYRYDEGPNGIGRRTSMTDPSGETAWSYDARGRVTAETKQLEGNSFVTGYTYRSDDQPVSMTYPDGEVLNYTYDAWGRPQGMSGSSNYASAAQYTAAGQLQSLTYGNGVATTWGYDPVTARLSSITAFGVLDLDYTYYPNGNVHTLTDGGQTTTFGYDELDRLTSATGGYSASYSYDPIGNLLSKTEGSVARSLTYPGAGQARPHAPTQVDGQPYGYDNNGNLTTRPGQALTYDEENRLIRVVSGTLTTEFTYDGDGNLVKKVAPEGTTLYVGAYLEVFASSTPPEPTPTPTVQPGLDYKVILPVVLGGYLFDVDGRLVPATKYYLFNGQRVATREGSSGTVTYLYHDHLGSTVATSEGQSTRYWPYGAARTGEVDTPYRYTGQRVDESTGLYYYQSRYFDPLLGRFVQPDTIVPESGDPRSLNRYSYVHNNPVKYSDPSGHMLWSGPDGGSYDGWDRAWAEEYAHNHGGLYPDARDCQERLLSLRYPGTGAGGSWTAEDWQVYGGNGGLIDQLGPLVDHIGDSASLSGLLYGSVGSLLANSGPGLVLPTPLGQVASAIAGITGDSKPGPDGTTIYAPSIVPPGTGGITLGNTILIASSKISDDTKRHEYVHVLQYREYGLGFGLQYLRGGAYNWYGNEDRPPNPYEAQALNIEGYYRDHYWLPPIWELPYGGNR